MYKACISIIQKQKTCIMQLLLKSHDMHLLTRMSDVCFCRKVHFPSCGIAQTSPKCSKLRTECNPRQSQENNNPSESRCSLAFQTFSKIPLIYDGGPVQNVPRIIFIKQYKFWVIFTKKMLGNAFHDCY